jgi:hypothetical protein
MIYELYARQKTHLRRSHSSLDEALRGVRKEFDAGDSYVIALYDQSSEVVYCPLDSLMNVDRRLREVRRLCDLPEGHSFHHLAVFPLSPHPGQSMEPREFVADSY